MMVQIHSTGFGINDVTNYIDDDVDYRVIRDFSFKDYPQFVIAQFDTVQDIYDSIDYHKIVIDTKHTSLTYLEDSDYNVEDLSDDDIDLNVTVYDGYIE